MMCSCFQVIFEDILRRVCRVVGISKAIYRISIFFVNIDIVSNQMRKYQYFDIEKKTTHTKTLKKHTQNTQKTLKNTHK